MREAPAWPAHIDALRRTTGELPDDGRGTALRIAQTLRERHHRRRRARGAVLLACFSLTAGPVAYAAVVGPRAALREALAWVGARDEPRAPVASVRWPAADAPPVAVRAAPSPPAAASPAAREQAAPAPVAEVAVVAGPAQTQIAQVAEVAEVAEVTEAADTAEVAAVRVRARRPRPAGRVRGGEAVALEAAVPAVATAGITKARPPMQALYAAAHRQHFELSDPRAALAAWDRYLGAEGTPVLRAEARYNRALCLLRLGRDDEALAALQAFVAGVQAGEESGGQAGGRAGYRARPARRLIRALRAGRTLTR